MSVELAKYIAQTLNKMNDEYKNKAENLSIPFDPFYYASDILKIVDEFNKA